MNRLPQIIQAAVQWLAGRATAGTEEPAGRQRGGWAALDAFLPDIRAGLRLLTRDAGLTTVVVLTLALGIGAATAAFSTVNAALLRRLPYGEPDRLVFARKTWDGRVAGPVSRLDYFDFRDSSRTFEGLAAIAGGAPAIVTGDGDPWQADTAFVSWNFFGTLGVTPVIGRVFQADDETGGNARAVVISHALWTTRFGRSPSAVGASLVLDGKPRPVIGVLPAGFRFLVDADVWGLVDRTGPIDATRDSHSHSVIGRLKRGVSLEQAQADVSAIARGLAERYPDADAHKGLRLEPLHDYMVSGVKRGVLLLMAVTALVLLIACANVTALLLARGQQRTAEMSMRSALGATRGRLVRQLLTESLLLTLCGGLLGLLVARGIVSLVLPLLSTATVGIEPPSLDPSVLAFAVAVSVACGLAVGAVPALRATASGPATHLGRGRQATGTAHGTWLRASLVVLQVATSIVLLVVAGLFLRSLARATRVDLGFAPDHLLTARLAIAEADYPTPAERQAFFTTVLREIAALPGVDSASAASKLPIMSSMTDWPLWRADRPKPEDRNLVSPLARWTYPGYLRAMRIPLRMGREISEADAPGRQKVVVLSESVARALYPDESPIGRAVVVWGQEGTFEVVGVAADAVLEHVFEPPRGAFYLAAAQLGRTGLRLVVRTTGDPAAVRKPLRAIVRRCGKNALLASERSMEAVAGDALADYRTVSDALGLFAIAALGLTAVGLYGSLAYQVSQQRHELAVRLAVGAPRRCVLGLIVRRGGSMAGLGIVMGSAAAAGAAPLVRALLFETGPFDLRSYVAAVGLLASVAALACLAPAWRATRIAPTELLRS